MSAEVDNDSLTPPQSLSPTAKPADSDNSDGNSSTLSEVYEVEKIVDYSKDKSGLDLYYVKWVGWDEETNTWEPLKNLIDCDEALIAFYLERRNEIQNEKINNTLDNNGGIVKKKKRKSKLELPPDPRPLQMIIQEFYLTNPKPTEQEFQECESKWRDMRMKLLPEGKNKNKAESSFFWDIMKIADNLRKDVDRKLSDSGKQTLRSQLLYFHFEQKDSAMKEALNKWQQQIKEVSLNSPIITVENNVDFEGPPTEFTYINSYMPTHGVTISDDPLVGCQCKGSCYNNRKGCCSAQNQIRFAYTKFGKLNVGIGTPIYECNNKCQCALDCPNRVVQRGNPKLKLVIYRTSTGMGWGVKTLNNIKHGSFIALYLGEIIPSEEADKRGKEYDAEGCTYLFDLDFHDMESCPYTVDAAKYGNVTHFINHSCDPNLAVFPTWINCLDPNLPQLALFAIKDISRGEELFFDYENKSYKGGNTKKSTAAVTTTNDETEQKKKICLCGTKKCRKYIF